MFAVSRIFQTVSLKMVGNFSGNWWERIGSYSGRHCSGPLSVEGKGRKEGCGPEGTVPEKNPYGLYLSSTPRNDLGP